MSHVTDIKLRVRDVAALKEACAAVGLELRENQRTYAWWGTFVGDSNQYGNHDPKTFGKCEHAIGVPGVKPRMGGSGNWEIGVVKAKDGDGFELLVDTYGEPGRRLLEKAGQDFSRLKQEYAVAAATRKAKATLARKGWTVHRENLSNGHVKLKLRKR